MSVATGFMGSTGNQCTTQVANWHFSLSYKSQYFDSENWFNS